MKMLVTCYRNKNLLITSYLLLLLVLQQAVADVTTFEIGTYPIKGPTKNLEKQVLDFRYAPYRWQACIGLADDPHKSIVGSDGGLYYNYGSGRGQYYGFGTRVLAKIDTTGKPSDIEQALYNPRIPIVITRRQTGSLLLEQHAWAGAPQGKTVRQWSPRRVDYLWLKMKNTGTTSQTGRIILKVDSSRRFLLNRDNNRLLLADSAKTFCFISPACASVQPERVSMQYDTPGNGIVCLQPTNISRNWGKPSIPCDSRFRDIMVGYGQPLKFKFKVQPGQRCNLALGFIESWHSRAKVRPLAINIEGRTVRKLDLVGEFGKNKPAVLIFPARDKDHDGYMEFGIYPPAEAKDKNTILSAIWIFSPENTPTIGQIISGGIDRQALATLDSSSMGQSVKLFFPEKKLSPGEEYQALITFYQGDEADAITPVTHARDELNKAIGYWQKVDIPFGRISIPDKAMQGLLDSCIRNIYQAREIRATGPAFQVGPTCYRGTWAADGPFILEAITYLGRADETRAGLETQVDKDEGPQGIAFSKKCGLRLWMIQRHAQLTGDTEWLRKMWPKVEFNVNKIKEYRRLTMQDPCQVDYGLMPPGYGDGGLGGIHREYTNVYWTLAGLKAAITMARKLQKPVADEWQKEYRQYWHYFDKARNRDKQVDFYGQTFVPVTMQGEQPQQPQRGAWAFLQSIFPGRLFAANDKLMLGTMAMLDDIQSEGLIYGTGWIPDGIWNYAGSFYAHAHLWLGHSAKAAATLYAFANHACPLLCWREEQNVRGRTEKYVGDMPHNWASAEFIRLVRHLLILERGRELHLLEALPQSWTKPASYTCLRDIPTTFGDITLEMEVAEDGRSAQLKITPPRREPPQKIVLHLEHFQNPVREITLDGKPYRQALAVSCDRIINIQIRFVR